MSKAVFKKKHITSHNMPWSLLSSLSKNEIAKSCILTIKHMFLNANFKVHIEQIYPKLCNIFTIQMLVCNRVCFFKNVIFLMQWYDSCLYHKVSTNMENYHQSIFNKNKNREVLWNPDRAIKFTIASSLHRSLLQKCDSSIMQYDCSIALRCYDDTMKRCYDSEDAMMRYP